MKVFNSLQQVLNKNVIRLNKRLRFVAATLLLSLVFLLSISFYFDQVFIFVPVLVGATYLLTYFAIYEGIEKIEWLTLFLMPVSLSLAFYLFYFLFPGRLLTRIPLVVLYGISMYAVLLASNIFNVGVEKNLQLYRAAFSINYFYQTLIVFFLLAFLFSLKLNFLLNGIMIFLLVSLFSFHLLWSLKLNIYLEKKTLIISGFIGLMVAELGAIFSFVPVNSLILALLLTSTFYSLGGLVFNYMDQKLFKEIVREYVSVWIFVVIITALSINW